MLMDFDEKIDNLFSFLKSHQKNKVVVFLTSCKQVRFVYSAFKKLKPGLPVLELHGRQKQAKRMAIYFTFSERKYCCLFTTSVSARGLDFPAVDWVVQADCPENVENYVHKVGRTARFNSKGKSMLFLTHKEERFIGKLNSSGISCYKMKVNPERLLTVKKSLQALCTEDNELKYLGQRAVISYLNSLHRMPDKEIFDIKNINLAKFARSYGLVQIPKISYDEDGSDEEVVEDAEERGEEAMDVEDPLKHMNKKQRKLAKLKKKISSKKKGDAKDESEDEDQEEPEEDQEEKDEEDQEEDEAESEDEIRTKKDLKGQKNALHNLKRFKQGIKRAKLASSDEEDDGDDLFLTKRTDDQIKVDELDINPFKLSNKQLKKMHPDGHFQGRNQFVFTDEGKLIVTSRC